MVKALISVVAICLVVAPLAAEPKDEIKGGMACKITSEATVISNEGKPVEGQVFSDGVLPDSTIQLKYRETRLGFSVNLEGAYGEHLMYAGYLYEFPDRLSPSITSKEINFTSSYTHVSFDPERIRVGAQAHELYLERYYKGDWHGTLSRSYMFDREGGLAAQIATLDCRTTLDAIDDVIRAFHEKAVEPTR
ncbi:MAG: hypothetical protein ACQEVT_08345 [Pseudomonadota bacterium]|uniref:hypothetical protein n=1 Tax=Roseovarius TaxID=74030 RepID=UPI0022A85AA5|nr:hypothetical protein [Roseovarius sp. EGI FJ00037]MCZ0812626.1 hypothetical protein [Roseovarius sp. EGI FJ00037]